MNALVTGICAFIVAALGAICPNEYVYLPALFSVIVTGGHVGGTIFSLQSSGVYDLHIRAPRTSAHVPAARLGGIWAYGLVGIPAGAIALLIIARMVGVDDVALAGAFSGEDSVAAAIRRIGTCLGVFGVTVVGGFLGLNLIRVVSDRVKAEIYREVTGQIEPLRLLEKGKLLMEEHAYEDALEVFRALAGQEATLTAIVWQGRALKRLGRLPEAINVLSEGLRTRGARDECFRRAVALWNLACYRTLMNAGCMTPETTRSIIAVLDEAIRDAPEFREGLTEQALDRDLVPLIGNPIFDRWRSAIVEMKR
jgi:hypothetical protein